MSRQTVRDLIQYLSNDPDCSEGMSTNEILDLPITFLTGHNSIYTSILSTYVSTENDGAKVMAIDIGE